MKIIKNIEQLQKAFDIYTEEYCFNVEGECSTCPLNRVDEELGERFLCNAIGRVIDAVKEI